jgi:hypothetical protein
MNWSKTPQSSPSRDFSKAYWLYLAAGAVIAAGFADFSLIAFSFPKDRNCSAGSHPCFLCGSNDYKCTGLLVLGKLLEKLGLPILLVGFGVPAFLLPWFFFAQPRRSSLCPTSFIF